MPLADNREDFIYRSKALKTAVDLYRSAVNNPYISHPEWLEMRDHCKVMLKPFDVWDNENNCLDELRVANIYLNLR